MTTDDRGDLPTGSFAADKDDLQRAVDEKTAAAEAEPAGMPSPVVNAGHAGQEGGEARPRRRRHLRPAAKKAARRREEGRREEGSGQDGRRRRRRPRWSRRPPSQPRAARPDRRAGRAGARGDRPLGPLRRRPRGQRGRPAGRRRGLVATTRTSVLGTHLTGAGWVVRTLRPDAVAVDRRRRGRRAVRGPPGARRRHLRGAPAPAAG